MSWEVIQPRRHDPIPNEYTIVNYNEGKYLQKDGTFSRNACAVYDYHRFSEGYWKTRERAQQFLNQWIKKEKKLMSNDKIKQCEANIKTLNDNLEQLKKEDTEERRIAQKAKDIQPKHGDIVTNDCGGKRIVLKIGGKFVSYDCYKCQTGGGVKPKVIDFYNGRTVCTYKVIGNVFDN